MLRAALAAALFSLAAPLACAQSQADLDNDEKTPENVLTYGMGYHQNRYSPLKEIDRQTVKRLKPVWAASLSSNYGEQGQPDQPHQEAGNRARFALDDQGRGEWET